MRQNFTLTGASEVKGGLTHGIIVKPRLVKKKKKRTMMDTRLAVVQALSACGIIMNHPTSFGGSLT